MTESETQTCDQCCGSGYDNHPDSGSVCSKCKGSGVVGGKNPVMNIFVIDDMRPEDIAMLQALYSRSPASVVEHLESLKSVGSGKFMSQYYIGYGHASIGDCGTTTCFIEQVSMLVAKAIQENPLYNGQEASTRYLDYSKQEVLDPYKTPESAEIQETWMKIYNRTISKLIVGLRAARPYNEEEYKSEKIWENTIKARAFDIARSLLPLGTTTLLSWSTSLRQARDNLRRLKHHPLPEVRRVVEALSEKLSMKYPNSFNQNREASVCPVDSYEKTGSSRNHFQRPEDLFFRFNLGMEELNAMILYGGVVVRRDSLDVKGLLQEEALFTPRPKGANLPWRLESYGAYNFIFLLDFGSFRDIQRHRNAVCQIPLVDGRFGFHPWYLKQFESLLSSGDLVELILDITSQLSAVRGLRGSQINAYENQYYYPMGMRAMVHVSYSIPETVYVGELRSGKTVHGSLRPIAQRLLGVLEEDFPGMALHGDMETDSWTAKRGEQTIVAVTDK